MSVTDTRSVDAIGVEVDSGKVVLTIADHLEWNSEHLCILQHKLNAYVAFIESGDLVLSYPAAQNRAPVIDVVCQHQPNNDATEFLSKVGSALETAGVELRWRVLKPSMK